MPRSTDDPPNSATGMEAHVSQSLKDVHQRILIADPDAALRERLTQHLRAHGFDVVTAAAGESAFS